MRAIKYIALISLLLVQNLTAQQTNRPDTYGDRLKMGYVLHAPVRFNPLLAANEYEYEINKLIFGDGLFVRNAEGNMDHALALSSRRENSKLWWITLRTDMAFQDRSPITSEDVKFSFELYKKFALQSPVAFNARYINKIDVINEQTVRIELKQAVEDFKSIISALPILPKKHYLEWQKYRLIDDLPKIRPVGNGYFLFRRQLPIGEIHLDAYLFHPSSRAYLEGIDFIFFESYDDLVDAFLQEQIDLIQVEDREAYRKINQFIKSAEFVLAKRANLRLYYINLNTRRIPFNDINIRQAFHFAVNKNLLVEKNTFKKSETAPNVLNDISPFYFEDSRAYVYDPLRSLKILEGAGYTRRQNGKLFSNNRELRFEFFYEAGSFFEESIARVISINLGEIGINILPRPIKPEEIEHRLNEGKYQAALQKFEFNPLLSEATLRKFYYEELNRASGFRNFSLGSIKRLFDLSAQSFSPTQIKPQQQRIQLLLRQQSPCVFLFFEDRTFYAIHNRFENYKQNIYENLEYKARLTAKHEWYVQDNKRKY